MCLKLCQPLDCELCRGGFNLLRNRGGRYFAGEEFERSVCYTIYYILYTIYTIYTIYYISRERNLSEVSVIRCIGGSEIGRWPVTDRPIIGMATRIVLSQTHEVLNTDTRPCRLQKYFLNFGQFSVPDVFTRFPDRSGWN